MEVSTYQCRYGQAFALYIIVYLQGSLFDLLFVTLYLIADLEVRPVLEADAAFGALAHFGDVLFDVSEGGECSCRRSNLVYVIK